MIFTHRRFRVGVLPLVLLLAGCSGTDNPAQPRDGKAASAQADYDIVIRGGTIYDGSGGVPFVGDVAIDGERIAAVGMLDSERGRREIDAAGMAVSPGFVDMLSSAYDTLPQDGRATSDLRQGVTFSLSGEDPGGLMNEKLRAEMLAGRNPDYDFPVDWDTLGGFFDSLERRGIALNTAAVIGITTIRKYVVGWEDRKSTPEEVAQMQEVAREAMRQGAMGVGICRSHELARYLTPPELTALASAAKEFGGIYSVGLHSESGEVVEALDEALGIARETGVRTMINHIKASGAPNWDKLDSMLGRIDGARADGLQVYTGMYYYTALWTALSSSIPPWAFDGGFDRMLERLKDSATRKRIIDEMQNWDGGWENLIALSGKPENVTFLRFKNKDLAHLQGKTLADAATMRGKPYLETALDLLIENNGEVWSTFLTLSEDNIRKQVSVPWMMFTSDAMPVVAEEPFTLSMVHPRAYGNVARLLSDYVREQNVIPLQEAVRKLTSLPMEVLGITDRGRLVADYYADVVVFDPATIEDHATYANPHQYSTGVKHVFVNGTQVLNDGAHTGKMPGKVIRGPGWIGRT